MIGEIRQLADVKPANYSVNTVGQLELIPYESKYKRLDFIEFVCWIATQTQYQVDIETNVTDKWNDKKLISIQFGSCETGNKRIQWFFQWSVLTNDQKATMKRILEDRTKIKIIHNARFEYIVLRFHGIVIENLYDTMLAEKILHGGEASEDYALADISWKYLRIIMRKDEQTTFGDDIITDSKILYGITDVAYLDVIKRQQIEQAATMDQYGHDLLNTFGLEMEDLLAFSDITYEGMLLNQEAWRENIRLAEPAVEDTLKKLNAWFEVEPFRSYAIKEGYFSTEDRVVINFNSVQQRTEILQKVFPDIKGGNKPLVQKYIRDNLMNIPLDLLSLINSYIAKNYDELSNYVVKHHRNWLIEKGWMIPKGEITVNWGSWQQVLPMFQLVEPRMKSTGKDAVEKATHPFVKARQAYMEALTLLSDYGEEFIHKHVDSDGKVRTNFNLILTTGRVSSSGPNMQNIIVNKYGVGTRYRNAFVCEEGWCFCDSDYVSQELVIIAHVSKDPVWMEAINKGQDLHSICCDLVFKQRWREATEDKCAYYEMKVNADGKLEQAKQKCSCKKHKKLRDQIKEINFG
jgi:hypothetical protein